MATATHPRPREAKLTHPIRLAHFARFAQLKLDAMVVQSGRMTQKDKLSNDELLASIRFGADKVFKTKDSSITDDDIDLILDQGKKRTEEMNSKLQVSERSGGAGGGVEEDEKMKIYTSHYKT